MDLHRLGEERSLAYHRAVAARLAAQPELMDAARARATRWLADGQAPFALREWLRLLDGPVEEVARFLGEDSERARELRSSSPFAGSLTPKERWRIWREVRQRMEQGT